MNEWKKKYEIRGPIIRDDSNSHFPANARCNPFDGCTLTAAGNMRQGCDLLYHIVQGTKCFHSNRWILQNRKISVFSRLKVLPPFHGWSAGPDCPDGLYFELCATSVGPGQV